MIPQVCLLFAANIIPIPGIITATTVQMGYTIGFSVFPYLFTTSVAASCVAFCISRNIPGIPSSWTEMTEQKIENTYSMLIALRLSPTPSTLVSYALGSMHHISFIKFLIASIIGFQKLWVDLMIGYNMNVVHNNVKKSESQKYIKIVLWSIGIISMCVLIWKIKKKM